MLRAGAFYSFVVICGCLASASVRQASAQQVQFSRVSSSVDGDELSITFHETQRIERFLGRQFPLRAMKRLEHTSDKATTRRVTYSIISQQGVRFILAGYTARWNDAVNVLAIYRMEDGGPNQVWRSRPWEASYYGVHFWTAKVGARNVVLFQEGGAEGQYGIASVFSFQNKEEGLVTNDLTPSISWLKARTHFPFKPLFAQEIGLRFEGVDKQNLLLTASDEEYKIGHASYLRPTTEWKYNRRQGKFEKLKIEAPAVPAMTNMGQVTGTR